MYCDKTCKEMGVVQDEKKKQSVHTLYILVRQNIQAIKYKFGGCLLSNEQFDENR